MSDLQWNADKTLAIMEVNDSMSVDNPYGMWFIRWTGSPEFVREYDTIAGFVVNEIAQAEHNGRPAYRFGLADEMGQRKVARLVVAMDSMHEASLEWVRTYDTPEDFERDRALFLNEGWEPIEARLVKVGDVVKDPDAEPVEEGLVTHVELVPADVRGGETGIAITLNTHKNCFWDRELDDTLLRAVSVS